MTADEASPLKASVRTKIADALNALELSTSLRALAHQLTPLTALPEGQTAQPPADLDAWRLNTDAHITADHAMLRIGGDGASGMVANFSVSLPAFTHGG